MAFLIKLTNQLMVLLLKTDGLAWPITPHFAFILFGAEDISVINGRQYNIKHNHSSTIAIINSDEQALDEGFHQQPATVILTGFPMDNVNKSNIQK